MNATGASSSRRLMWAGFLAIFVWGSVAPLLGSILPGLRDRAGLSLSDSGWLFVSLSAGLVVASLVAGFLLDKRGKKQVLCAAVSLVAAGLVGFELTNTLAPLLLSASLIGAGGSALVTAGHGLIADLNPEHRAASLNLLDVFFGLGLFITPALIVPLQRSYGLTGVLLALASLAALVLVYFLSTHFPPALGARAFSMAAAGHVLVSPFFLLPALVIFLYVGTEQSVSDWQVTYFMRQLALDNVEAARVFSVFAVAIMAGRIANNRLLLRLSPYPVLLASTVGIVLALVVMMLTTSKGVATAALFACGLFMASVYPTTLGILSARFPEMSGTALGLAITAGWFGSMALSPAFGFVAHRASYTTAYLVVIASAGAMVLAALGLLRQRGHAPHGSAAAAPQGGLGLHGSPVTEGDR